MLQRFGGIVASVMVPDGNGALDAAVLADKTLRDVAAKSGPRLAVITLVSSRVVPFPHDATRGRECRRG